MRKAPPPVPPLSEGTGANAIRRRKVLLPKSLLFCKTIHSSLCPYYSTVKLKMLVFFHKNFSKFSTRKTLSNICEKVEFFAGFRNGFSAQNAKFDCNIFRKRKKTRSSASRLFLAKESSDTSLGRVGRKERQPGKVMSDRFCSGRVIEAHAGCSAFARNLRDAAP